MKTFTLPFKNYSDYFEEQTATSSSTKRRRRPSDSVVRKDLGRASDISGSNLGILQKDSSAVADDIRNRFSGRCLHGQRLHPATFDADRIDTDVDSASVRRHTTIRKYGGHFLSAQHDFAPDFLGSNVYRVLVRLQYIDRGDFYFPVLETTKALFLALLHRRSILYVWRSSGIKHLCWS